MLGTHISNSINTTRKAGRKKKEITDVTYTAVLHRFEKSDSYYVTFRHPFAKANDGRGRKVKKSLGEDFDNATKIVAEINAVLSNPSLKSRESLKKYYIENPSRGADIVYTSALTEEEIHYIPKIYTASLSGGNGKSFTIAFRHPLLEGSNGKLGRKVKKGLGKDENTSKNIAEDLNVLLSSPNLWTTSALRDLKQDFNPKDLEIFFNDVDFRDLILRGFNI